MIRILEDIGRYNRIFPQESLNIYDYSKMRVCRNLNDLKEYKIGIHEDEANLETLLYHIDGVFGKTSTSARLKCRFTVHPFSLVKVLYSDNKYHVMNYNNIGHVYFEFYNSSRDDIIICTNPSEIELNNRINSFISYFPCYYSIELKIKIIKVCLNLFPYIFYRDVEIGNFPDNYNLNHIDNEIIFDMLTMSDKNPDIVVIQQGRHGLCWLASILNSIYVNIYQNGCLNERYIQKDQLSNLLELYQGHYNILEFIKSFNYNSGSKLYKLIASFFIDKKRIQFTDYGSDIKTNIRLLLTKEGLEKISYRDNILPFISSNYHIFTFDDKYIYDSSKIVRLPLIDIKDIIGGKLVFLTRTNLSIKIITASRLLNYLK